MPWGLNLNLHQVAILVARVINIYLLSFLLNWGRKEKISYRFQHMLVFAGLFSSLASLVPSTCLGLLYTYLTLQYPQFCTQLTKAETSCNQLLLID